MVLRAAALVSLALVASACDVGSVGNPGDDDPTVDAAVLPIDAPPTPTFAVTVSPPTATTTLGTTTTFTVTLTSSHFAGAVDLAATGASAGWTVTFDTPSVTLADGGTATATATVRVPSNGDAAPTGAALTFGATSPAYSSSGSAALTVTNDFNVDIGAVGGGQHFGALRGTTLRLKAGTRLHIRNNDTIAHRIHSGGGVGGFDHQAANMNGGGSYDVTPTDGADSFYCHVHGVGTGSVNLVIE